MQSRYQVILIEVGNSQDPEMCSLYFNTSHKLFRYLWTVKNLRMLSY